MTAARREETEMSDRGLLKHVNMANLRGDEIFLKIWSFRELIYGFKIEIVSKLVLAVAD